MAVDVRGDGAGGAAHIGEGEVVGDHAAPAVRAEFDRISLRFQGFIFKIKDQLQSTHRRNTNHDSQKRPGMSTRTSPANHSRCPVLKLYPQLSYTSLDCFCWSKCLTILPTSCERSMVVISSASPESTTTRPFTPTAATNL